MNEKRFINDVSEILDTWFGYMGEDEPTEREINEKDFFLIGVARSQRDAENICEKLNEQNEELIEYCNFSLHDLLDKKNKEIEQLKQFQDSVFSWIDMHLQRLPTLRDDEFESDNEFADPSLYSGAIQILETMKRELKGDVE